MNKNWIAATLAVLAWNANATAPGPEDRLGQMLTPLGGERAASEDGSVPAWQGGLASAPPCYQAGGRYCDPYAGERPYLTINASNLDEWRDRLSAGQIEMIQRHPDSYRIQLYRSRRSFANPPAVYEAARENAKSATLAPSGREVRDASVAIPFPITRDGLEMVWNHRLRYRGPGSRRWLQQAVVSGSGEAQVIDFLEDLHFPYGRGLELDDFMALYWLRVSIAPENLAGAITLIHDSLNHVEEPSLAWQRGTEDQIMVRDRSHGFDHFALLSSTLRMDDQLDTWFGNPERYTWRVINKQPMVVPYNSYALHNRENLARIIRPAHPDPALPRYELHRVWVVEASTKPSAVHRVKRRRLYIDEDSWQILMVDLYDAGNRLWRWQETHTIMAQDHPVLVPNMEIIFDLDSARYWLQAIADDRPEMSFREFERGDFGRGAAQSARRRALAELPPPPTPEPLP